MQPGQTAELRVESLKDGPHGPVEIAIFSAYREMDMKERRESYLTLWQDLNALVPFQELILLPLPDRPEMMEGKFFIRNEHRLAQPFFIRCQHEDVTFALENGSNKAEPGQIYRVIVSCP